MVIFAAGKHPLVNIDKNCLFYFHLENFVTRGGKTVSVLPLNGKVHFASFCNFPCGGIKLMRKTAEKVEKKFVEAHYTNLNRNC